LFLKKQNKIIKEGNAGPVWGLSRGEGIRKE
jgi:hypothetical protein